MIRFGYELVGLWLCALVVTIVLPGCQEEKPCGTISTETPYLYHFSHEGDIPGPYAQNYFYAEGPAECGRTHSCHPLSQPLYPSISFVVYYLSGYPLLGVHHLWEYVTPEGATNDTTYKYGFAASRLISEDDYIEAVDGVVTVTNDDGYEIEFDLIFEDGSSASDHWHLSKCGDYIPVS